VDTILDNTLGENYFDTHALVDFCLCVPPQVSIDTDVALHRKVFQNIELKETCVRITKSNLTRSSNKT
jgi:hypothetical protein